MKHHQTQRLACDWLVQISIWALIDRLKAMVTKVLIYSMENIANFNIKNLFRQYKTLIVIEYDDKVEIQTIKLKFKLYFLTLLWYPFLPTL